MTRSLALRLAAPAALTLAIAAAPAAPVDWTKRVVDTGVGYRMGNPAAKTRLIEYGSFNCPHCAAFAKVADGDIRRLVKTGRVSFEFRPKLLFPHDPSATALARCVGPARFFAFTADYMANAPEVSDRLQEKADANPDALEAAEKSGVPALARTLADWGGMAPIAARAGLAGPAYQRCLGNAALFKTIDANEKKALGFGVTGTPTFFINGKRADFAAVQKLGIAAGAR